ncbi:unnamed protein product [Spirodela intermedia]|uniref:Dof zinc finger protein n=1 Tax=Spirodela intermedia TaxID=51605 RepID=A0A7I8J0M2_SPIIN|nr:unnamed protein product [Spirodela intermedia]CAA6663766.1 unnamed protein product [Spirodela intermedia]
MEPYSFLQSPTPSMAERRWNPAVIWAPRCPRCESSNTKFCYYNNYSLSQPRYFCKACRRYWTAGGALRNVPVGGATRRRSRAKAPAGRPHSRPPVLSEPGGAATVSLRRWNAHLTDPPLLSWPSRRQSSRLTIPRQA